MRPGSKALALYERAERDRRRVVNWLKPFMARPKFCTKEELRAQAIAQLGVSKQSFDAGWISAIEDTKRYDWYEPLRGKRRRN